MMRSVNATFNYTNRRRIERQFVQFDAGVDERGGWISLTHLQLNHLELPDNAELVVECRTARRRVRRFEVGTVSAPRMNDLFFLGEPSAEGSSIVLKVVNIGAKSRGRILAKCDGLRPLFGGKTESLLTIIPADLGERMWNLNFDPERGPELQINENFPAIYQVWGSPVFLSLVMPAVVKDIAIWLVEHRDVGEDDPLGEVVAEWKGLFGSWGCSAEAVDVDDLDARQSWADDVSGSFAARSRYFTSNMDVFSPVEG